MNRQLFIEWFPQIMYNHHQTGPAGAVIFMPPFRDPFNYNFDPLVPLGIEMVGTAMHSRLVAEGKGGSAMRSGANYSTWWNGGLRTITYFHNMIGILTEIIGNPTPMQHPAGRRANSCRRATGPCPSRRRPGTTASRSITRSRNNRAILDLASRYRETFLFNIWRMGMNSIETRQQGLLDRHAQAHRGARSSGRCRRRHEPAADAADAAAVRRRRRCSCRRRSARGTDVGGLGARTLPAELYDNDPARPQAARSARLHHPLRPGRFRHRHRVRQRAAQERHHGPCKPPRPSPSRARTTPRVPTW